MENPLPYQAQNKIRIVTAASLFDGHDASINIMRRILQASGAEVIHLGHDRSAEPHHRLCAADNRELHYGTPVNHKRKSTGLHLGFQ